MRTGVAACAVFLASCALFIPDYYANLHLWTPPPPHVDVRLIPFGDNCATEQDDNGKWYRPALVLIHVVELPPLTATVSINGEPRVSFASPLKQFSVYWRAGVGVHRVDTDVGGHKATRVLTVYRCRKTKWGEVIVE